MKSAVLLDAMLAVATCSPADAERMWLAMLEPSSQVTITTRRPAR
jgi:hypothetical protein